MQTVLNQSRAAILLVAWVFYLEKRGRLNLSSQRWFFIFLVSVIIQTSAAQDVISGCYSQKDGKLRIVNDSSECKKTEDFIQWNVQGEQGPAGECECPITQEQVDEIYSKIEHLESITTPRFTDMDDGTIRDNNTGLIWLKNANCFNRWMSWTEAKNEVSLIENGDCSLTDESIAGD